jgi:hypothetical protein
MTAPGNTPATDDLWAELDAIAARADAWAEMLARFHHPSTWTPDTEENER